MKLFRDVPNSVNQVSFLPPVLDDVVPSDAKVRVLSNVLGNMDCSVLLNSYRGGGAPAYSPHLLLKILVFAYSEGVRSSRRIEERCRRDTYYMWLSGMSKPDHHTICRFRRKHEQTIKDLFRQSVELCMEEGLVLLENIAGDGTKITADVSSKETYNKERAEKAISYTQQCIDAILKEAEALDVADDRKEKEEKIAISQQLCVDVIVEETKSEVAADEPNDKKAADCARKKQLSAKTKKLLKKLERRKARAEAARDHMEKTGNNAACATDLDARVMNCGGLNRPAYNAQAAVDSLNHVIVGACVSQQVNDSQHVELILDSAMEMTGGKPATATFDSGFYSIESLEYLEKHGIDGYISEGKTQKAKAEYIYDPTEDVLLKPATDTTDEIILKFHAERTKDGKSYRVYRNRKTGKETWMNMNVAREMELRHAMHEKLSSTSGKFIYSQRQQIVEPTFGHLKGIINLRRFLLRGLSGANIEFFLACSVHNILKVFTARMRRNELHNPPTPGKTTQNRRFTGLYTAIGEFLLAFRRQYRQIYANL
jgi:transposase